MAENILVPFEVLSIDRSQVKCKLKIKDKLTEKNIPLNQIKDNNNSSLQLIEGRKGIFFIEGHHYKVHELYLTELEVEEIHNELENLSKKEVKEQIKSIIKNYNKAS